MEGLMVFLPLRTWWEFLNSWASIESEMGKQNPYDYDSYKVYR